MGSMIKILSKEIPDYLFVRKHGDESPELYSITLREEFTDEEILNLVLPCSSWFQRADLPVLVPVPYQLVALGLFLPLVALPLGLEVELSPRLPEDSGECPRSPGWSTELLPSLLIGLSEVCDACSYSSCHDCEV